ncbi:MAG TPA: roadblock/LC7 domain-containing protein [Candidatus Polarisedimenticolaceae bacterium]|nr:roadblock/LC7 domain-containing protein [Candidatus Polarisedimenticolaceae bacterium]
MTGTDLVIRKADHERLEAALGRLREEAAAKFVFLLDKSGQQLAGAGEMDGVDSTALASLAAGNVAATEGLAQLIGESEFSSLFHEGRNDSLHINVVAEQMILLIAFDGHSSLGLVRLRVQQRSGELGALVTEILTRSHDGDDAQGALGMPEITDEDIDALFG